MCNNQKSDFMEEAARIISKAFSHCITDRYFAFLNPNDDS